MDIQKSGFLLASLWNLLETLLLMASPRNCSFSVCFRQILQKALVTYSSKCFEPPQLSLLLGGFSPCQNTKSSCTNQGWELLCLLGFTSRLRPVNLSPMVKMNKYSFCVFLAGRWESRIFGDLIHAAHVSRHFACACARVKFPAATLLS